jgi:hypothetical protein
MTRINDNEHLPENNFELLIKEMEKCSDWVARNKRTNSSMPGNGNGCETCEKLKECTENWDDIASEGSNFGNDLPGYKMPKAITKLEEILQNPKQGVLFR